MSSIIQILEKMEELMYIQSEPFKARAYNKAKETIINKVMNKTNQKTNKKTNEMIPYYSLF